MARSLWARAWYAWRDHGPWLLAFRLLNAWNLRTSFNPDEYWQGPEVSHAWRYGDGHLTWEWEKCVALRGVLHPGIFALLLTLLPDWPLLVAYAPRLLQGALASFADLAVYRSAERLGGKALARWALCVQLASWFQLYAVTRTFSSSLESVLAALVIDHLTRRALTGALVLGSLQVAIRPTAAGFWLAWAAWEVGVRVQCGDLHGAFWKLLVPGLQISGVVLSISTFLDSLFYQRFTLVPWNFVQFNLMADGGALYGSHPWHWYLEGLAVTLGTFLPFCCVGVGLGVKHFPSQLFAVGISICLLSLASHKEYRFLLPFFPIFSLLTGQGLQKTIGQLQEERTAKLTCLTIVFLPQIIAALFFCLVHQRGAEAVMAHLRQHPAGDDGVFFLTACHATPFYSFVHGQGPLGYLDCSPGQGSPQKRFFEQPMPVLREIFPEALHNATERAPPKGAALKHCLEYRYRKSWQLPEVFVLWGSLLAHEPRMGQWLEINRYQLEVELQDGVWSEGPYDVELWPSFSIW
ncbi:Mannosyltransferase APTG1 (Glycosyltransferase 22) (Protein ABNORMAL POLLEN TUBE GUIDANCE 1), partial [Durusdinium trenchii]